MKTGIANVACATITGFSSKIDRLLERRRAKRIRPGKPDLPVLSALSGAYRRMSGDPLPVIDQAAQILGGHGLRIGKQQTIAPPPGGGAVVAMKWRAPLRTLQGAGRARQAV